MTDNSKVWLITGSSTGFGRSLTEAVLEKGDIVVATARKPEQLDNLVQQYPNTVKAIRLDVTIPQEVHNTVNTALAVFGRIDVLVNNAGYGALGAIEEVSEDAIRRQFETNVFGVLNMTRAVLPLMRQQRSGHILNLSSIGGFVAFPGVGVYNGSKFALEGISEALAQEVAHLGIKVTIVEPGAFRTDFNGRSLAVPDQRIGDYAESSGKLLDWATEVDGQQPGDPDKAAGAMIQIVESANPPLRLVLGADAVNLMENKLQSLQAELDAWREVSVNTAFEGAEMMAIGG
ncbi:SDR family NAD(P)-dependent oxidoreductase [Oscillatoria sp. FACHB-1407]|uniref:oxidoreductase n=1 Tax=Oscillatoria sp. FACHB-1407 TaxID=2692847 RepID=UPI001686D17D|nr:oxidoreductase [Oscillatoria sp. FACHB-1407]MBD2465683.1 SDR family NAD(P)-dependent oxidoreductase [Oscillatoria sp. FACHB-1407]